MAGEVNDVADSVHALIARVRAGEFTAFVGALEGPSLECKREPYRLDAELQKLELVKDVCGLANAGGGVLLLGFGTTRDPDVVEDRISEVQSFPWDDVDPKQYQQIVAAWTWPKLAIDVERVRDPVRPSHAIAIIAVPAPPEIDRPVLATAVVLDGGKRSEKVVGYFERNRSDVRPADARQLHAWISAGRRYETLLQDELATIRATVLELAKPLAPPPPALDHQEVVARSVFAIRHAELNGKPTLLLKGVPSAKIDLRELLDDHSRVTKLVAGPPRLRASGFQIHADGNPRLVLGKYRRATLAGLESIELHRDGFAIVAIVGDEDGLCYAMGPRGTDHRNINPRALAEMTLTFVLFLFEVYRGVLPPPGAFEVRIELATNHEGKKYQLPNATAPASAFKAAISVTLEQNPAHVAYLLLQELYGWFGQGANIPFTKRDTQGQPIVDAEQIITVPRNR